MIKDLILERFAKINQNISANSFLVAVHEGDYIYFQTVRNWYAGKPLRLFAFDLPQQKIVLDMVTTEQQYPHSKIDINRITGFYTFYEAYSETYTNHLYAITHNEQEIKVSSQYSNSAHDLEKMAVILGTLCNKPVRRQKKCGDLLVVNDYCKVL